MAVAAADGKYSYAGDFDKVGGLPVLTPTLRWVEGMELYVCGALSAMQIGPDAFNLAGAGAGAARVVSAILTNR